MSETEEVPTHSNLRGPLSTTEQIERSLVASALRKAIQHKPLTIRERDALQRHETAQEERKRWEYYAAIPAKHWKQMSGRPARILIDQAERYRLPFGGAVVNLPAVVRALHDFLAANAMKLAGEDDLMRGENSPWQEKYREERTRLAQLDRLERENQLIPRDQCRQMMGRVAAVMRNAAETLQRQYGPGALEIYDEALDDADAEIDRFFGEIEAKEAAQGVPVPTDKTDRSPQNPLLSVLSATEATEVTEGLNASADDTTRAAE